MSISPIDYLIIGPAHPFRGGIAETQHELAKALLEQGFTVRLITFTKLYPKFLFPGSSPYNSQVSPKELIIEQAIHAYHPWQWKKTALHINSLQPKNVIFRYYTPFLAPVYSSIAKYLKNGIKKIALVDNWFPHESKIWDRALNRYFRNQMHGFTTLSEQVAKQIKKEVTTPVWPGFHPIATNLSPIVEKQKAKISLGWSSTTKNILFFGLIRKYKGLELLIQSFANTPLKEQNDIHLYVAGECYENPKKYIALVKKLHLENRVTLDFTFKDPEDVALLFSAADVVAQTYHTATQSGVTPYAYFYEKPLLVSDISGLNELIKKDSTGICTPKKPQKIAKHLLQLLDPINQRKFQENIKKVKDQYRWKSFAQQWHRFNENI